MTLSIRIRSARHARRQNEQNPVRADPAAPGRTGPSRVLVAEGRGVARKVEDDEVAAQALELGERDPRAPLRAGEK